MLPPALPLLPTSPCAQTQQMCERPSEIGRHTGVGWGTETCHSSSSPPCAWRAMPGRSTGCAAHHTSHPQCFRCCLNCHQLSSWASIKEQIRLTGFLRSICIKKDFSHPRHSRTDRAKGTSNALLAVTASTSLPEGTGDLPGDLSLQIVTLELGQDVGSCPASALPQQSPTHSPSLIFALPNKHREKMDFNLNLHTSNFP